MYLSALLVQLSRVIRDFPHFPFPALSISFLKEKSLLKKQSLQRRTKSVNQPRILTPKKQYECKNSKKLIISHFTSTKRLLL